MGAIVVGESVGDDVTGGSVLVVGIGVGLPDGELLGLNVGEVDTVGEELGHGPAGVGRVERVGLWLGLLVGTNLFVHRIMRIDVRKNMYQDKGYPCTQIDKLTLDTQLESLTANHSMQSTVLMKVVASVIC